MRLLVMSLSVLIDIGSRDDAPLACSNASFVDL
jgi:hypothetical protein